MIKKDIVLKNISSEARKIIATEAWPFEYRLYAQIITDEIETNKRFFSCDLQNITERKVPIDLMSFPDWLAEKIDVLQDYYLDFVTFYNLDHEDAFGASGEDGDIVAIIEYAKEGVAKFYKDILLLNQEIVQTFPESHYTDVVNEFINLTKSTVTTLEEYGPNLLRQFKKIENNPNRASITIEGGMIEVGINEEDSMRLLEAANNIKLDIEQEAKETLKNDLFLNALSSDNSEPLDVPLDEKEQYSKLTGEKNKKFGKAYETRFNIHINGYKNFLINFIDKYSISGPTKNELRLLSDLFTSKGISTDVELLKVILFIEKFNNEYLKFEQNIKFNNPITIRDYVSEFDDNYSLNDKSYYFLLHLLKKEHLQATKKHIFKILDDINKQKELLDFERSLTGNQLPKLLNDIDRMTGQQFEMFLASLYENMGHEVKITKSTGDQGGDLVTTKNTIKFVIQAKRYSSTVGNKAIQEIIAARLYYKIDNAVVITSNYFTNHAIELAESAGVRLVDRKQLKNLIEKYQ